VAAQQAITDSGLAFSTVRLSVGAEVTSVDGGGDQVFYLQNIPDLVPVPEPATFALIGAGLIGVGLLRRRHHRR